ncbi:MAG: hypothetical protein ENTB_02924 [Enterocloster aldenensis]
MKKCALFVVLAMLLAFVGCSKDVSTVADYGQESKHTAQSQTEKESEDEVPKETASNEESKPVSQSEPKVEVSLPDPVHEPDQKSESGREPQNRAEENAPEPKQPAAGNGQPTPESKQPEPPKPTEPPAEPKQEETPAPATEPESPKTIYDYAFDVEAIRSELIVLGQSMGLIHITEDDGIPCTPDTCSWASPVTASESFQGNNLKRALQNYVTSMPSTIASYGGTQITCFSIYVRDNGGGSYTFYFLY